MKNIPYSSATNWKFWLDLLTPKFRELVDKEETYLVTHVKQYLTPFDRIIEIGCGSGRLISVLSDYVREVVGIEHDYLQVQTAENLLKRYFENEPVSRETRVVYADGKDVPYPADYFDLAFSVFNTLGNQGYDKFRVLKEMRRVVKTERNVVVSVYAENAAEHQVEFYKKVLSKSDDRGEIKISGDFVIFESNVLGSYSSERFSKDKLARLFRDTGFTDFDIDNLTDFSYVVNARK